MSEPEDYGASEDKAGYNRAARISDLLSNLTNTFNTHIMDNDFPKALEAARSILNVISGKVAEKEIEEMDKLVYEIEDLLPEATKTHKGTDGNFYITNVQKRKECKRKLEYLIRRLERLQDKYGYGMYSSEDPKRAIYKR